jgi:oligopeptide/dipeptide ABC transporter ATP-binding protein
VSPLLQLEGVSVAIRGITALHDVTLGMETGECLGLVGETGSGKSLTCRVLTGTLGRIRAEIRAGKVLYDGRDITHLTEAEWKTVRGRQIGFVPQSSLSGLDPVMRIGRQLREAIRALDAGADAKAKSLELLDRVQLRERQRILRAYPHELSGGMRQRVMIALALAGDPHLLVADEPTTALDVTVQRGILELLESLRRESSMTVLLVTHDLAVIRDRADRVAVMYSGSVVERGWVSEIFERPVHPYTKALLGARPAIAAPGTRLTSIPGAPPPLDDQPPGCAFAPRCSFAEPPCNEGLPDAVDVGGGHVTRCRRWKAIS